MPKKVNGSERLTLAQESCLMVLHLAELRYEVQENNQPVLKVTGAFFNALLGLQWDTYHRNIMKQLQELGWIHITVYRHQNWYSLTDLARFALNDHMQHAKDAMRIKWLELPF